MMERFLNEYCSLELKSLLCFPSVIDPAVPQRGAREGGPFVFWGRQVPFPQGRHLLKDLGTLLSWRQVAISMGGPRLSSLVFTSALWLLLAPWSVCVLECGHACRGLCPWV